jgi:hypothetical protein
MWRKPGLLRMISLWVASIALKRNLTESYLWYLGNIPQRPPSLALFRPRRPDFGIADRPEHQISFAL